MDFQSILDQLRSVLPGGEAQAAPGPGGPPPVTSSGYVATQPGKPIMDARYSGWRPDVRESRIEGFVGPDSMDAGPLSNPQKALNAVDVAPPMTPPPFSGRGGAPAGSFTGAMPKIDRSDFEALLANLKDKGAQSINDQRQGITDQTEMLKSALGAQNPQLDLSPLMALTDSWTGSKLQQGYQRPDYRKDNETVNALQEALQKGRNSLSEREVGLLKDQLDAVQRRDDSAQKEADRWAEMQNQLAIRQQQQGFHNDMMNFQHLSHAQDSLNKDSGYLEGQKSLSETALTDQLLAQATGPDADPVARKAAQMSLAKAINPQRLTETEMKPFGGSDAIGAQISQAISNAQGKGLTDENLKFLTKVNNAIKAKAQGQIQEAATRHAKQLSVNTGMPVSDATYYLTGSRAAPETPASTPSQASGGGMDLQAAARAEIERRKKGAQ